MIGRYLELIWVRAVAELKSQNANHFMGSIWWFLDPVLYMLVFYFVFSVLPIRNRPDDFVAFLLVGLVPVRWFMRSITATANSILANRALVKMIYVPKWIFPMTTLLGEVFKVGFVFVMLFAYLWYSGYVPTEAYAWLPVLLLTHLCLIVSVALPCALLVTFIPDFRFVINHAIHVLFMVSGVFYSGAQLPEQYQQYFFLNPLAVMLDLYRDVLLGEPIELLDRVPWILAGSLLMIAIALIAFSRLDRLIPKIIVEH